MAKPPFFLVGCPRSGTSLLRNLLRSHPNLTIPSESHFIPRCYRTFGDPASAAEARRTSRFILETSWLKYWEISIGPDDFADCRSYREIVCRLFETYARQQGAERWGDKTPQYATELPTLMQLFPDAKIIHIIRDGRDVAWSWLRTRYHPLNYFAAGEHWKRFVETAMQFGASAEEGVYLEVRYEALLERPEETMRTVCGFLGEPFLEDVLRPTPIPKDVSESGGAPAGRSTLKAGNASRWRGRLSTHERALFESVSGGLLASLGYEVEGLARPISVWERTYWRAHQRACAARRDLGLLADPNRLRTRAAFRLMDLRSGVRAGLSKKLK